MIYCLNPTCPQPRNSDKVSVCQTCRAKLPQLLHDRYRVQKKLGKGGFGATFLAADWSLPGQPICVIKQLRPSSDNPQFLHMARELFKREAHILGSIGNSHPQIPRLLDYFEEVGQFYLVQEYVQGNNLQQEVKQGGPYTEMGLRQFLMESLSILQDVHHHKVIHRDIKPANILRRVQDNKLVLIDFGAVKNQVNTILATNTSDQTALTSFAVGTPGFAPPEQIAMRPVYASDIYALGVTGVYLLTGKSPKDLNYHPTTGEMQWRERVDISDSLAQILATMMEVNVRDRFKSAEEVLTALDLDPHIPNLQQGLASQPFSENLSGNGTVTSANLTALNTQWTHPNTSATSKLKANIRSLRGRRHHQAAASSASPETQSSRTPKTRANLQSGFAAKHHHQALTSGNPDSISAAPQKLTTPSAKKLANSSTPAFQPASGRKLTAKEVMRAYAKGQKDFPDRDLSRQDFSKARLDGINLHQTKLMNARFRGAKLAKADFGGADLRWTVFCQADLSDAYLHRSNLNGADLRGADLTGAHLRNANLQRANLCGANLRNAHVTQAQLDQAKTNFTTIFPNGKRGFL